MHVTYNIASDRFYVFESYKHKIENPIVHSASSNEYIRYIPQNHLSLRAVNAHLASNQYEACIEITNKCNFNCPICISDAKRIGGTNLTVKRFTRLIHDLPKSIVRLTITGGEPTLNDGIEDILNISTGKFGGTVLSTNGYHFKKLESIIKNRSNLIVAVSLHGPEAVHDKFVGVKGAFKNAVKSIRLSIDNHFYTHVYTTATLDNHRFLPFLFEVLVDYPITEHRINLVKDRGRIHQSGVGSDAVENIIQKFNKQQRITIKKIGHPFIFIDCHGKRELRNVG